MASTTTNDVSETQKQKQKQRPMRVARSSWLEPSCDSASGTAAGAGNGNGTAQGLVNLMFLLLMLVAATQIGQGAIARRFQGAAHASSQLLACVVRDALRGAAVLAATLVLSLLVWGLHVLLAARFVAGSARRAWTTYVALLAAIVALPSLALLRMSLAPLPALIVGALHVIIALKTHSFFAVTAAELFHRRAKASKKVSPAAVPLSRFLEFLAFPTLVYVSDGFFPRTLTVRIWYCAREFACAAGCMLCIGIGAADFVAPVLLESAPLHFRESPPWWWALWTMLRLAVPAVICWMLGFYALFHNFMNGLAELCCFSDRLFYTDWWNAESMDVFWRRWNIPMHEWLGLHVYMASRRFSVVRVDGIGGWLTFFVSACIHELVLFEAFRVRVPLFFALMVLQVPAIGLTRALVHKLPAESAKRWGNCAVWSLFVFSFPLILTVYIQPWLLSHNGNLLSLLCV